MLSVTSSYDKENSLYPSNGKSNYSQRKAKQLPPTAATPSSSRKALGEITNTSSSSISTAPARKALSEITNKQSSSSLGPQKTIQKVHASTNVGGRVKRVSKPKAKVQQEVPDVERMHPFKYSPLPDLPGLDFHVNQFLVPMVNVPYSLEYIPEIMGGGADAEMLHGFLPPDEAMVFDLPMINEMHVCGTDELRVTLDDPSLTEDLLIV